MLAGLVVCGLCQRRMDAHWLHGRAGYRCRHGQTSSHRLEANRAQNVYVRGDKLIAELIEHLACSQPDQIERADYIVADCLRAANSKIVCTRAGWTVATESQTEHRAQSQGTLF